MARAKETSGPFTAIAMQWAGTGPTLRLLAGTLVVLAIGMSGLTPKALFDTDLAWPYVSFIAATCWGRVGLAFRPMVLLTLFGFIQDVSAYAPLGCFAFINLAAYGASAGASATLDLERAPVLKEIVPVIVLLLAFLLLFVMASFASGHPIATVPLGYAFAMTFFTYLILAPVFDLGRRPGTPASGRA